MFTLITRLLLCLLILSSSRKIVAQEQQTKPTLTQRETLSAKLQEKLDTTCEKNNLPGMWAGKFFLDGSSVVCASGLRKVGATEKAEVDDIVHLGSCTKAMTAVLIAQLCSEGKIRLDSNLGEIFSDVVEVTSSKWADVTLRELLQHRSGLPGNVVYQPFDAQFPDSVVEARRALLKKVIAGRRPKRRSFVYSNIGYIILGHVVERIDQKSWEEAIQDRLFKPLEIKTASFGPVGLPDTLPAGSAALPGRAWGHTEPVTVWGIAQSLLGQNSQAKLEPIQLDNSRCLGPAGRVHMSLKDWSKFVVHFADAKGYESFKIKPDVWADLLAPSSDAKAEDRYAGGWIIVENPDLADGLFHNGSNTTWYCYAFAVPSKGCCVLVATNVYNDAAQRECDAVARFMLKEE